MCTVLVLQLFDNPETRGASGLIETIAANVSFPGARLANLQSGVRLTRLTRLAR